MSRTPANLPRAALYARVSTSNHGQDVGLQLDELRQVAAQRGYAVTEYVDQGVSGIKTSRPALDRMLADAQAGKLDVVLVWKLDRLGRSPGCGQALRAAEEGDGRQGARCREGAARSGLGLARGERGDRHPEGHAAEAAPGRRDAGAEPSPRRGLLIAAHKGGAEGA